MTGKGLWCAAMKVAESMALTIWIFVLVVCIISSIDMSLSLAESAELQVSDSYSKTVEVNVVNDLSASVLCFTVSPFPTSFVFYQTSTHLYDYNPTTKKVIVYSIQKAKAVATGKLMDMTFNTVNANTVITVTPITNADITATAVIVKGDEGSITLTFSDADTTATARSVIGLTSQVGSVIDFDKNGVVDAVDVASLRK